MLWKKRDANIVDIVYYLYLNLLFLQLKNMFLRLPRCMIKHTVGMDESECIIKVLVLKEYQCFNCIIIQYN